MTQCVGAALHGSVQGERTHEQRGEQRTTSSQSVSSRGGQPVIAVVSRWVKSSVMRCEVK